MELGGDHGEDYVITVNYVISDYVISIVDCNKFG